MADSPAGTEAWDMALGRLAVLRVEPKLTAIAKRRSASTKRTATWRHANSTHTTLPAPRAWLASNACPGWSERPA